MGIPVHISLISAPKLSIYKNDMLANEKRRKTLIKFVYKYFMRKISYSSRNSLIFITFGILSLLLKLLNLVP